MNISEITSLEILSKENDVINCAYSDVPLLAKVNLFIRRSELACSPATYITLLNRFGNLKGVHTRLAFLRVGAYDSLSIGLFKWLHSYLPCRQITHKFYLLSDSLLVVAKAAPYIDTSYNYDNAQVSMGKVAVHCTSTQPLHCETRNKVFKSFLIE